MCSERLRTSSVSKIVRRSLRCHRNSGANRSERHPHRLTSCGLRIASGFLALISPRKREGKRPVFSRWRFVQFLRLSTVQHQTRRNPSANLPLQDITSHTGIGPLQVAQAKSSLDRLPLFFRADSICRALTGGYNRAQSISLLCNQDRVWPQHSSDTPLYPSATYSPRALCASKLNTRSFSVTNPAQFISLGSPPVSSS